MNDGRPHELKNGPRPPVAVFSGAQESEWGFGQLAVLVAAHALDGAYAVPYECIF